MTADSVRRGRPPAGRSKPLPVCGLTRLLPVLSLLPAFPLLCFLCFLSTAPPAYGASETQSGASGTPGTPGVPGTNGGSGGAVVAVSNVPGDPSSTANATGGAGGNGGNAARGDTQAGNGGRGGNASAVANTVVGKSPASALAHATGGRGGNAAEMGKSNGGGGGSATASASASNTSADPVTVTARADGGTGGSPNIGTAGNGGDVFLGPVTGTSTGGGPVNVTGLAFGGHGGGSYGVGGAGASVSLDNAVGGDTSGLLSLSQSATGGNAADASGATTGTGGGASSLLQRTGAFADLRLNATATGGFGGRAGTGTDGGSATSRVEAGNTAGPATATARSVGGGAGPSIQPVLGAVPRGGDATSTATAQTAGAGHAASATSYSQAGRSAFFAPAPGAFGNAVGQSVATALGDSPASASATVMGDPPAAQADSAARRATGRVTAFDGVRAFEAGSPLLPGGNASATATASNAGSQPVKATAYAAASRFSTGTGTAAANTTSRTGPLTADATASGSAADAQATANSSGAFRLVRTTASLPGGGTAQARATVAPSSVSNGRVPAAASLFNALPPAGDVLRALSNYPAVHRDLNVAGEGAGPLSAVVALATVAATGRPRTSTAAADASFVTFDPVFGPRQELLLGLLGPGPEAASSLSFDSLHFQVTARQRTVVDQTFTNPADAVAFFHDRTLDLGLFSPSSNVPLDLSYRLDITGGTGGQTFSPGLIFANATPGAGVPEPGAVGLVALALGGSLLRRPSRAAPATA